jgi:microcin C transport system substrate-binding protein
VNPDAPKGGLVRLSAPGGYDSFNIAIPRGVVAAGINQIYETLMAPSSDEVSTEYGLLAEAVKHPADFSSVTYRLRAEARWQDGQPVTPEDVIWSLGVLKTNSPNYAYYYRNVARAEATGEREVTFFFEEKGNRELPQIVGQLQVLPKHWWEGTDAQGRKRDTTQTTLEPPLGSGPYRIKPGFAPGRTISYERVQDHWGKNLPVYVGQNNFDEIRYDYYRDSDVALEAFKADQYDFRVENSAKNWATAYDFPARQQGKVVVDTYPIRNSGLMQAFAFNTRREKFKDPRLRRAFDVVMNFEEMNRALFYGQYTRIDSYFENTELASSGLPQGRELEILETVRNEVPPEVFTTPYFHPPGGDPAAQRENLREAVRLLGEAGWTVKSGGKRVLTNAKGEPLTVEFLIDQPVFERVVLFYKQALDRLGVQSNVRAVDDAQYENRVNAFDFDVIIANWPESLSPGNEQRDFWGSAAADRQGSRNYVGIKNPAVDKLIERVVYSTDRDDLVAATRALDRVLLWNNYVVPQWTLDKTRYAYWNRFAHPEKLPEYSLGFPDVWWFDATKSASAKSPPQ